MQSLVTSLNKSLKLIECFTVDHQEWGVTDLAKTTQMDKSQVSRILRTFEAHGFIQKNVVTGKYQLGRAFRAFSALVRIDGELRRLARPIMEELSRNTRGTVNLKVREGWETVAIEKVESQHFLRIGHPLGLRLPLNAAATGKVFLAFMHPHERELLNRQGCFRRATPKTKTKLTKLERELTEVRRKNFAFNDEESFIGAKSVAAPIFWPDGTVEATLSLGLPKVLFPKKREEELGVAVQRAAMRISTLLGYKAENKVSGENPRSNSHAPRKNLAI